MEYDLLTVCKDLWDEPYLTKHVADSMYNLFMNHRMHHDVYWHSIVSRDSDLYKYLFVHEKYRWLSEQCKGTIFNIVLRNKKDNCNIDWALFERLIKIADKENTGQISRADAKVLVADAVEAVHPSGIQNILNRGRR